MNAGQNIRSHPNSKCRYKKFNDESHKNSFLTNVNCLRVRMNDCETKRYCYYLTFVAQFTLSAANVHFVHRSVILIITFEAHYFYQLFFIIGVYWSREETESQRVVTLSLSKSLCVLCASPRLSAGKKCLNKRLFRFYNDSSTNAEQN
jgi:hypothetical protein